MARLTQVPHPLVLLPGHLVLTSHGSGTPSSPTLQVHLYPITNFDDLWQPMSDFNFHDCIEVGQLSSIHLQVADQTPARYNVTLTCDESVLHHDTYELCVQIQNSVPPSPVTHFASLLKRLRIQSTAHNGSRSHMFTIYRCHVVLPPQRYSSSEPPKLVFKSKFCHSKQTRSMSRAGYGLELGYPDGDWGIYRLDKVGIRVPKTLLPDLDFAQYAKLTPLGAVFAREENRVVILEYQ
ncbi:hypothetical protein B0H19DRAFT_1122863 [Mycena capillaripes]|nr:hypothetical protein B0H19DRAFT_1122863 [Mycena capillaripes]